MGQERSWFEGEPPDGVDPGLAEREPFLRRVLDDFESGRIEPYEYTRRVLAINAAASPEEMAAIVHQPSGSSPGQDGPEGHKGLDAVDIALLASSSSAATRHSTNRYVALAVVFVTFAVLIGIGMWLATHAHGAAL